MIDKSKIIMLGYSKMGLKKGEKKTLIFIFKFETLPRNLQIETVNI